MMPNYSGAAQQTQFNATACISHATHWCVGTKNVAQSVLVCRWVEEKQAKLLQVAS